MAETYSPLALFTVGPLMIYLLAIVFLCCAYSFFQSQISKSPVLPWVGRDKFWLYLEKVAHIANLRYGLEWQAEGYEKFLTKDKSYLLPNSIGKAIVMVPRSQTKWLLSLPDDKLSVIDAHYDLLAADYSFTDAKVVGSPYHDHVLKRIMIRRIASLVPSLADEVSKAFDDTWGLDSNWKDVPVFPSTMSILPRILNRMLVGPEICRNEDYLKNCQSFAIAVMSARTVLRFVPSLLRCLIGPLVAIPNNIIYRNIASHTIPIIEQRIQQYHAEKREKRDSNPTESQSIPNDYISWQIILASMEGREDELKPDRITRRLLTLNFAGIHTTTLAVTNMIFNLCSSEASQEIIECLREEALRVYEEEGGQWNMDGLKRLHRLDSAMRESMRLSNITTNMLTRKVVSKGGVTHEQGWSVPQGCYISVDEHHTQHDSNIYTNPYTYDAFRFIRCKDDSTDSGTNSQIANISSARQPSAHSNTSFTTTSDIFLPFGHGRHACPGRFFVDPVVKLSLAYMIMNYNIEPLKVRPANRVFGQTILPPLKACIKVRRRGKGYQV